mmetsp:Transcript_5030/g.14262  ORF Transcript_5030/g.14262 Transcript_5030/m.14262 type:complete len:479 (+) Transcript_5030:995-2431(+)
MYAASSGLDDLLRRELVAQAGEPCEDFDLVHQALELRASVQLHVHAWQDDVITQVFDVRVQVWEARRQRVLLAQHTASPDVLVEGPQLVLHGRQVLLEVLVGRQSALHEEPEALREADPGLPRGMQDAILADRVGLLLDDREPVGVLVTHSLEPRQQRGEGVGEQLLRLDLHVPPEVVEPDGLHVLGRRALLLHHPRVEHRGIVAHVSEWLRRHGAGPVRQGDCEASQLVRQVAEALQPLVHVLRCEVVVVLVELVADQDCPPVGRVDLLALPQRSEACSIAGLLHAQHDVVLVLHELVDELVDLVGEVLHRGVLGVGAESRQVDEPEVHCVCALDLDSDGHLGYGVAQSLVRLADDLHHPVDRVRVPHERPIVEDGPPRRGQVGHIPQLEHGRAPGAQRPRDEIERLPGKALDQPGLAHALLANDDELGYREVHGLHLAIKPCLHLADEIQEQLLPSIGCVAHGLFSVAAARGLEAA